MRLSHSLPPLTVAGNRILNTQTGNPHLLRGLNRSGLEYSNGLQNAGITAEEIDEIITGWHANIVRLPFNQEWALRRDTYHPEPYLEALDFVIQRAALHGAYTLLDLQWLDATTKRGTNDSGTDNFVAPLPNQDSIKLWGQLAARYANEPAVLFDIFNEPHNPLPGDPLPLCGIREDGETFPLEERQVTMAEWQPWARHLIAAIRSQNPSALIFVSGIDWGYDLRGFPIPGLEGLVYSTHIYRNKGDNWREAFGRLSHRHPVFAAEWGGGPADLDWGQRLAGYLAGKQIGWTAWSWADDPKLVDPSNQPTDFGSLVKRHLS